VSARLSESWGRIRAHRASPPGQAGHDDERRRFFQTALAQAEELWDAASVVGPAARPLPLFYCLSQAGRAISAAWVDGDDWQPTSHGLSSRASPLTDPLSYSVKKTRDPLGAFAMVADATGSATFNGSVTVAELWASLLPFPASGAIRAARPLILEPISLVVGTAEERVMDLLRPTYCVLAFVAPEQVDERLAHYPTSTGYQIHGSRPTPLGRVEAIVSFPGENGELRPLFEIASPTSSGFSERKYAIRPRIGTGGGTPPSELMTLWALVYAFSQLARYHPDLWVTALDPDKSEIAVLLENGIDVAMNEVAGLLLPALSGTALHSRLLREDELTVEGVEPIPDERGDVAEPGGDAQ
jgi:hypothetical protein